MATVKINKNVDEKKTECGKNDTTCRCHKTEINYDNVPVYTDEFGNIHVNKEYAKEFPQLVDKLVQNEMEKMNKRTEYKFIPYQLHESTNEPQDLNNPFYRMRSEPRSVNLNNRSDRSCSHNNLDNFISILNEIL